MSYDEMIAVIQAERDGAEIERRQRGRDTYHWFAKWRADAFNFLCNDYRIASKKRAPRQWWLRVTADNHGIDPQFNNDPPAQEEGYQWVRVQEIPRNSIPCYHV